MTDQNKALPILLLVALTLMWGSSFILIKKALTGLGPAEVGAVRVIAAGTVLLPLAIPRIKRLHRRHWGLLFVVGLTGTLIPAFLFAKAQTGLNSSVAGILNALTPFSVMFIGALFFKQKYKWSVAIGLVVGFIGSVMLMFKSGESGLEGLNFYALYILLATICYGTNLNLIKFHVADLSPAAITSISLLIVLPIAVVLLFTATDFLDIIRTREEALPALGYVVLLGIMSTGFALILYNKLVQLTTPIFTSSVTYLIPIVAVGWGLLDGETLTVYHYIGMVLIISGVYLVNYVRRAKMR